MYICIGVTLSNYLQGRPLSGLESALDGLTSSVQLDWLATGFFKG